MSHAEDALARQIEVTCKYEAEVEVVRAERDELARQKKDLELAVSERDKEIQRLHAMIDGAFG